MFNVLEQTGCFHSFSVSSYAFVRLPNFFVSGSTLSNPSWPLVAVVLWQNQQLVQQLGLQEVLNPVAAVVFSFNNCRPATLQHASTKGQVKPQESAQTISNHSQIITYNYSISLSLTVFFKYKDCWPISKATRFRLHSMQKKSAPCILILQHLMWHSSLNWRIFR